jgi:CheY-like chemotaxis protein
MVPESRMPNSDTAQRDETTGLSGSRSDFAASLKRRLESVLDALSALELQPTAVGRRDNFLRRLHALGASAKVLGFAAAAEVLTRAEQQIRTGQTETLCDDLLVVRKQLGELPSLVLRGAYSLNPPSSPALREKSAPPLISEPLAVVVWGTSEFVETVRSLDRSADTLEVTSVTNPENLRDTCVALGPDILLLDANQGSITLLVDELAQAPELANIAIVVANVPDDAASRLLELGARFVLPSRATGQQLSRALLQARHVKVERAPTPAPLGEVTLKDLAERLAQELRQGLVDAAPISAHLEHFGLGDGTPIRAALWSALAQIREQIVERSNGRIQFTAGPEGGVPLAPRSLGSARGIGQVDVDAVDLTGRRILVVDDDPAVAWLVGGTLRAAGAVVTEAHDGSQALDLAYRIWPELIVSDVMMPGLDGFALCHSVKHDVLLRDVPVVLLSWKEDLLFRLRDLGADADGYLRKEANASTIVRRVRELLSPRNALERRLSADQETRGRLDGMTTRLLLEVAAALDRPVRIALRDASALYDIRLRHGSLVAVTRTRRDGTVENGDCVLGAMLGITAGRFSVVTDHEPCEPMFSGSLAETLQQGALRARAAQRLLSGLALGLVDRLTLDKDAFGSELPILPMSLRPIADELLRGTAPRQLLASGVASVQLLESLLSDVARRGAVRSIADAQGEDLLDREILSLATTPSIAPPKPLPAPPPLFTFELSPGAPDVHGSHTTPSPTPSVVPAVHSATELKSGAAFPAAEASGSAGWDLPSGTLAGVGHRSGQSVSLSREEGSDGGNKLTSNIEAPAAQNGRAPQFAPIPVRVASESLPASTPPLTDNVDWAMELSWDSVPPPPGQDSPETARASATKPTTSGGFMRPAIATLERRSLQETPDLANAVARAVSEATPSPVTATALSKLADPAEEGAVAATAGARASSLEAVDQEGHSGNQIAPMARGNAVAAAASQSQAGIDASLDGNVAAAATTVTVANQPVATATVLTAAVAPADNGLPDARTPRPTGPNDDPSATSSLALGSATARTLIEEISAGDSAVLAARSLRNEPLAAGPNLSAAPLSAADSVATQPPGEASAVEAGVDKDASPGSVPTPPAIHDTSSSPDAVLRPTVETPRFAQSPAALPDVHQPPRPRASPAYVEDANRLGFLDRESEDPVFPLVSTANVGVEIQPSIEVGASKSQASIKLGPSHDSKSGEQAPAHNRDTLRSSRDSSPELAKPRNESAGVGSLKSNAPIQPAAASPACTSESPLAPSSPSWIGAAAGPIGGGAPLPSPQLNGAPLGSALQQSRPVGWIQALGLAALAGIVTFAITVPIASWVHKRQEPPGTEPPVLLETLPGSPNVNDNTGSEKASSENAQVSGNKALDPDAAPKSGDRVDATGAQPSASATIEEIPLPAEVTLPSGQGLIEVITGGGHAIFVDDSFVGRGPVRVIAVQPGRHLVRTRLNGVERSDPVDVGAGRSLRVSLEQAWK